MTTISAMLASDWPSIRAIYAEGISTGTATFETEVPDWEKWNASHLEVCRLTARDASNIFGWAALCRVSARPCYAGVAEVSVYVAQSARGRGIGRQLLHALIEGSEPFGVWTLQATTFATNEISIHLHQQCGFRIVGRRERIAQLHGQWHDTVLLERRSPIAGK
ncbi:MAG TPA: GNAT family N-acetyltransferase [Candidatus Koribacter sp.]|jgi:phosphinothricin acetyltransferase